MGKKKSAVFLVLITILIAVLCVASTVSFPIPNSVKEYHSFVDVIKKDSAIGGGYTTVYYPEGVISAEEFENNAAAYGTDTQAEQKYRARYASHANGAIYLEKEIVLDEKEEAVSEAFKTSFANTVKALEERFEAKHLIGTRLEVSDDYTIRATLPAVTESPSLIFGAFAYAGEVSVAYGTESDKIIENTASRSVNDYIKGAYSRYTQDTAYVVVDFTKEGRELIKNATAGAAENKSTLYVLVGDNTVINLSVSQQIDQDSLFISGSYTKESAEAIAIVIEKALHGTVSELDLTAGAVLTYQSVFGENTALFLYISFGVLFLAMLVYFFVRYRGLGVAHLYGYLTYWLCMIMCLAFIPFLHLSVGTVAAVLLTSVLLCVSNAVAFEYVKKEYALGKTMTSSVKTGYGKCIRHLIDLHVILAVVAFLTYAIALTELQTFAFVFGIGTVLSGVCTLVVTRFIWAITMTFAKHKDKFCNFKHEEEDDDE